VHAVYDVYDVCMEACVDANRSLRGVVIMKLALLTYDLQPHFPEIPLQSDAIVPDFRELFELFRTRGIYCNPLFKVVCHQLMSVLFL
jgi:hypothetical protein